MKNLPSLNRYQLIEKKMDEHLSKKQTLLLLPEVQMNVHSLDLEIANASVELPIRKYNDEDLMKNVEVLIKFICIDYGIQSAQNEKTGYLATRFFTTLKKYYPDFSLREVKFAFELASVGELDDFLPKDKNGNPDNKHYNSFNVEYYTKILNAYRSRRSKSWNKVKNSLPKKEIIISKEERLENRKVFLNDIYESFYKYRDEGKPVSFQMKVFAMEFVEQGLLKELKEPTKLTVQKAYRKIILQKKGSDRKKLIDDFHKPKFNNNVELITLAKTMQNNIEIQRVFDKLIEEEKDIKEVLKL